MITKYPARECIFSYVSPSIKLFPTTYGFVFGTRHGVSRFADDIGRLYALGYFRKLIISGGMTDGGDRSEAVTLLGELVARGMSKDIMTLEEQAMNTAENVMFSRSKIGGAALTDLLLIGKLSSARRYVMTVRKHWPEIKRVCCHKVNYFDCEEKLWWKEPELRKRVISEYRKISSYLAQGHIQEIEIVNGVVM